MFYTLGLLKRQGTGAKLQITDLSRRMDEQPQLRAIVVNSSHPGTFRT